MEKGIFIQMHPSCEVCSKSFKKMSGLDCEYITQCSTVMKNYFELDKDKVNELRKQNDVNDIRIPVGTDFVENTLNVPGYSESCDVIQIKNSGYYFVITELGAYFVGKRIFDIASSPIVQMNLLPIVKNCDACIGVNEYSVDRSFDLQDGIVYYSVEFGKHGDEGHAYIFQDKESALQMMYYYLNVKEIALSMN